MSPKVKAIFTLKGMAILLIVWWVYSAPASAAHMANKGLGGAKQAGHSAQAFLTSLHIG
jgi:hypothetical protein